MTAQLGAQLAFLIGRLLVGGIYLWTGIDNLLDLNGKAGYAAFKGLVAPHVFVTLASLLLVVAGISLVTGLRPWIGVGAVVLFLLPVTVIMHNFWALEGIERIIELHGFQGNLGLLGSALMVLAIRQPWSFSLDRWIAAQRDGRRAGATNSSPS